MMDGRAIRNADDPTWALREIEPYFAQEPAFDTPEAARFDVLTTLIEAYENRHCPIPESDPIGLPADAIEHLGRSQAELAERLGSRSRASEILGRKRGMTLDRIRVVSEARKIPIAAVAKPCPIGSDGAPRRKRAESKRAGSTSSAAARGHSRRPGQLPAGEGEAFEAALRHGLMIPAIRGAGIRRGRSGPARRSSSGLVGRGRAEAHSAATPTPTGQDTPVPPSPQ